LDFQKYNIKESKKKKKQSHKVIKYIYVKFALKNSFFFEK